MRKKTSSSNNRDKNVRNNCTQKNEEYAIKRDSLHPSKAQVLFGPSFAVVRTFWEAALLPGSEAGEEERRVKAPLASTKGKLARDKAGAGAGAEGTSQN